MFADRNSGFPRLLILAGLTLLVLPGTLRAENTWNLALYGARNSPDRFVDILTRPPPEMRSSWLYAMTLGYTFYQGAGVRMEAELQLARHTGMQRHYEVNAIYLGRWSTPFTGPNRDLNLALGHGLSWASEVPPIEPRSTPEREDSTRLLHYMLLEIEFRPSRERPWSGFTRIHHRSGVFGLFDNVRGGSNFIALGIRYRW